MELPFFLLLFFSIVLIEFSLPSPSPLVAPFLSSFSRIERESLWPYLTRLQFQWRRLSRENRGGTATSRVVKYYRIDIYIYIYMSAEFHSPPISRASKFARDLSDLEPTNRCDLRGCTTRDWPRFVAFGNEICQRFRSSGTEKLRNACTFPLESLRALLFSPSLPSEIFFVYQQFIYEIVSEVWLQIKWYNIVEIIRSGLNYLGI